MNIDHCPTVRKKLNLRDSYAPQIKRWFNVSFPIPSRFALPGISVQKQDCKSKQNINAVHYYQKIFSKTGFPPPPALQYVSRPQVGKELIHRNHLHTVHFTAIPVERHGNQPAFRVVFGKSLESVQMTWLHLLSGLDFNGHTSIADNGIHFIAGSRPPIGKFLVTVMVSKPCDKFLNDKMFKFYNCCYIMIKLHIYVVKLW